MPPELQLEVHLWGMCRLSWGAQGELVLTVLDL